MSGAPGARAAAEPALRPRPDLFRTFLEADPDRLHFAAHSHHPWPDASLEGQRAAWQVAADRMDRKWDVVFGEVLPAAQGHVARTLNLPDPSTIAFAPSVHELFLRVLSCFEIGRPVRILSTDSEFHSFERQSRRLEEAKLAYVERVPTEPFEDFPERFATRAATGEFDLVYVSHVFFNSGYVIRDLQALVDAVPASAWVFVDGYHAFWALPVDLSGIADRAFYSAGGYKYAMSGEGMCFLHAPPGYGPRPVNTGWFAGFGALESGFSGVPYAPDGGRFLGATFDPTGAYRFRAVMDLLAREGIDPAAIHAHVRALQERFLGHVASRAPGGLSPGQLVPGVDAPDRGNFLTFRRPDAQDLFRRLLDANVVTDVRGDRLRFGFGIYHRPEDVDALVERLGP
ncbi:MAG: aminotransferase class V-fold PLP-dependent enzyme [bacterium]